MVEVSIGLHASKYKAESNLPNIRPKTQHRHQTPSPHPHSSNTYTCLSFPAHRLTTYLVGKSSRRENETRESRRREGRCYQDSCRPPSVKALTESQSPCITTHVAARCTLHAARKGASHFTCMSMSHLPGSAACLRHIVIYMASDLVPFFRDCLVGIGGICHRYSSKWRRPYGPQPMRQNSKVDLL